MKYINNDKPRPNDVLLEEDLNCAEFLCFAQHVQWQVTHQQFYTSDFQRMLCSLHIV